MVPIALGLSALLLADALVVTPGAARAGGDEEAGAGTSASAGAAAAAAVTTASLVCTSGFEDTSSKSDMSLHGVTLTNGGAVAVGFSRRRQPDVDGRRRPAAIINAADRWTRVYAGSPGEEDGLVAVASRNSNDAWAVGFTTINRQVMPLAMRWNGREWTTNRPKPRGSMTTLLTDVAILREGDPFAVGYRMTASGKRQPIAVRKSGARWRYVSPNIGKHESVSFTGVALDGNGGLWTVGHGGNGAEIDPIIYRRDNAKWKRMAVPRLKGEAVLADVVATARAESWAVGYQRHDGVSKPLVLRWNGKSWKPAEAPTFESPDVVLTAVSSAPEGGIWVVGAAWNAELGSHEAVAAWWDGQAWNEVSGREGGNELHDVVGSLDGEGWAVGRAGQSARTTRVCTPAQAGIFGSSEPSQPAEPRTEDDLAAAESSEEATATESGVVEIAEVEIAAEATIQSALLARKRKRTTRIKTLPKAKADKVLYARNVAKQAGIAEQTGTYGAVVADFDADGIEDLFIGRHGRKGRLVLNRSGVFVDNESLKLASIDRHGCTAADIDGSGLPDLYCAIGGKRGSGLKANELWLDPGGPSPVEVAVESGISDPTGRGRATAFLKAERQGDISLVVTNSPTRVDGLPSVGRLFRSLGDGEFSSRARPGFAPRLGSLAVQDADFDRDGREDLLLVTGGLQAPRQKGTRLYRNTQRGLVDVTRKMGIRSFGEVDAELVDLNRDGKLDLVQLSPTKLRVSKLKNGRFRTVWERTLTHGRAVATGDVNGDGKGDIYIVRSNGARNSADIMLINRNAGSAWSSMLIPQVYSGSGDDAYAIDHDGNGLDDFLVLNGHNERGPVQLVAFYKR